MTNNATAHIQYPRLSLGVSWRVTLDSEGKRIRL